MEIEQFSTNDLRKELEKRGHKQEKIDSMPAPLENPDFSDVIKQCKEHVLEMIKDDYCEDNNSQHYIYEASIEAVFGPLVWNWINNQT